MLILGDNFPPHFATPGHENGSLHHLCPFLRFGAFPRDGPRPLTRASLLGPFSLFEGSHFYLRGPYPPFGSSVYRFLFGSPTGSAPSCRPARQPSPTPNFSPEISAVDIPLLCTPLRAEGVRNRGVTTIDILQLGTPTFFLFSFSFSKMAGDPSKNNWEITLRGIGSVEVSPLLSLRWATFRGTPLRLRARWCFGPRAILFTFVGHGPQKSSAVSSPLPFLILSVPKWENTPSESRLRVFSDGCR